MILTEDIIEKRGFTGTEKPADDSDGNRCLSRARQPKKSQILLASHLRDRPTDGFAGINTFNNFRILHHGDAVDDDPGDSRRSQ